jgi:hypothetical protein
MGFECWPLGTARGNETVFGPGRGELADMKAARMPPKTDALKAMELWKAGWAHEVRGVAKATPNGQESYGFKSCQHVRPDGIAPGEVDRRSTVRQSAWVPGSEGIDREPSLQAALLEV